MAFIHTACLSFLSPPPLGSRIPTSIRCFKKNSIYSSDFSHAVGKEIAIMEQQNPKRPSVKVDDSKWTAYFIDPSPLPWSHQPETTIKERRDELTRKVRRMIKDYIGNKKDLLEGMKTVDAVERLGVGYHFEQEIAMFMQLLNNTPVGDDDLSAVALRFRLLRQNHYNIPCDVLESFKDENGDFKDTLRSDVDALLSLYEAAHLGKCDEDLLSRAVVFTADCLSSLAKGGQLSDPVLEKKVQHALTSPTQRRMKRLEARLHISIYEKDEESNQDILELAKLDFHMLQLMHRDEVKSISLWYKDLNPAGSTLGEYIRERPVECYFWALGVFYEPQYAKARIMFAKLCILFTLFDDTYDSYGTLEELHLFNQAVQSWDEEGAKHIGKCFGYVMSNLSKTLEEFVADGASPLGIDCTKETLKKVSKCMLQEVIWREEGQVPPVDDHLKVTTISTTYWALACISFVGMGASHDVFTWALSFPKIIENAAMILRLMDDISGHECEKERSNVPAATDCYVKEHGVTVEQAKEALSFLVEEQWKSINQEFLSNIIIPVPLLTRVINLARVVESLYKKTDGFTHCSTIVDCIDKVLVKCVYD